MRRLDAVVAAGIEVSVCISISICIILYIVCWQDYVAVDLPDPHPGISSPQAELGDGDKEGAIVATVLFALL